MARGFSWWSILTGMRSDIVAELDWRFGELAAWAVGQSTLAPPVAGMSVITAGGALHLPLAVKLQAKWSIVMGVTPERG